MKKQFPELTENQKYALDVFVSKFGRTWKSELREQWMKGRASPELHALCNTHGPSWLQGYRHEPPEPRAEDQQVREDFVPFCEQMPNGQVRWFMTRPGHEMMPTSVKETMEFSSEGAALMAAHGMAGCLERREDGVWAPGDFDGPAPLAFALLVRVEGPVGECDGRQHVEYTLEAANNLLRKWSKTAPQNGGYDKCDFKLVFGNGVTYSGRYDLMHFSREEPSIERHVYEFVGYCTNVYRPPWTITGPNGEEIWSRMQEDNIRAGFFDNYRELVGEIDLPRFAELREKLGLLDESAPSL
jgi:hypothetical protein